MRKFSRAFGITVSYAVLGLAAFNTNAQEVPQPPITQAYDRNEINLGTGSFRYPSLSMDIGGAGSGLGYMVVSERDDPDIVTNHTNNLKITPGPEGASSGGPVSAYVSYNGKVYRFYVGTWSSYRQNQHYSSPYLSVDGAASLTCTDDNLVSLAGSCTLTLEDGTTMFYDRSLAQSGGVSPSTGTKTAAYGTIETRPDGEIIERLGGSGYLVRSSLGWMLKGDAQGLKAINTSDVFCEFTVGSSCSVPSYYPVISQSVSGTTRSFSRNGNFIFSANMPTIYSTTITSAGGRTKTIVTTAKNQPSVEPQWFWDVTVTAPDGHVWGYDMWKYHGNGFPGASRATVTNPNSTEREVAFTNLGGVSTAIDELNRTIAYQYVGANVTRYTPPGGDANGGYTAYTYDSRNRIKTATEKAKSGSGLADQVTTVEYMEASGCVNPKTCNKPLWIKDAKNNQTDYTYYATHGGVETVTLPADVGGVRAKTRNFYTQLYPQIKNASGVLVNSTPVWRLTRTETCASTQTLCDQAGDTVTEYQYVHPNLLMTATIVRSGDNTVSATTLYEYDYVGNTTAVDGPLAGTVDKAYTTYDVLRRKVFEIGPDPDGAGPLKRQVVRHKYDADSLETRTESGTVNDSNGTTFSYAAFNIANPDLAPYTWATAKNMYYDGAAQLIKTEVVVP